MKQVSLHTITFLILLSTFSCSNISNSCIKMDGLQNDAVYEPLVKGFLDINFPNDYSGGLIQGFEGDFFTKTNTDDQIVLSYFFDNGIHNSPFGWELNDSLKVKALNKTLQNVELPFEIELCYENEGFAKFYHNDEDMMTSQLYLKVDGKYLRSLTSNFPKEFFSEILDIHKSIKEH